MHLRKRTKSHQEYRVVKKLRSAKIYSWPIGPQRVWAEQWRLAAPVREIIFRVCQERNVFIWQVMGTSKQFGIPYTRWLIWRAVNDAHPDWSLTKIGLHTGIFDHTSVWNGLKRLNYCEKPHPPPSDITPGSAYYRMIKADPVRFGMLRERQAQHNRRRRAAA